MRWTDAKPTKSGWYWFRLDSPGDWGGTRIVEVREVGFLFARIEDDWRSLRNLDVGEWSSEPIPMPEEPSDEKG